MPRRRPAVLWVGGTSALARTYFEEVHAASELRIVVAAPTPPAWTLPKDVTFVELDLLCERSVATLWERVPCECGALVLGVRLSLVWAGTRQVALTTHLRLLLHGAADAGCSAVCHISSVAVMDHVSAQRNVDEDEPLPPMSVYRSEYDRFKRICEDLLDEVGERIVGSADAPRRDAQPSPHRGRRRRASPPRRAPPTAAAPPGGRRFVWSHLPRTCPHEREPHA